MKILFVNTQLSTGGIASSLINLCEQLKSYSDISIDLILMDQVQGDERYKIPKNVNLIKINSKYWALSKKPFKSVLKNESIINIFISFYLKLLSKLMNPERYIKFMIKNMTLDEEYDVAISFRNDQYQNNKSVIFGCNDFVLKCINASKKIAWIHNDPDRHGFTYEISKEKFKDFDNIVNVSQGCKDRFDEIIPEYKYKSKLVYNSFNYKEIINKANESNPYPKSDKIRLVTVGRVSNEQKRMDRIIEICNSLREKNINNYIWYIVGDGPDLNELREMVEQLNLKEKIVFIGRQSNPFPYMKNADCLVMTSEYEAFPMTLNESIILGTPIITTNHISGEEIVKNNNGFLAENSRKGIEEKVELILKDKKLLKKVREKMAQQKIDKELPIKQFFDVIGYNKKGDIYEN